VHNDAGHPRPRGYLQAPGTNTYTELTEEKPSLFLHTDGAGLVKVRFRPGTDTAAGGATPSCLGKQRGVTGTYVAKATLGDPRFADRKAEQAIEVDVKGFVQLTSGAYYTDTYQCTAHPNGDYGTDTTMKAMPDVAQSFHDVQIAHNYELTRTGGVAWPLVGLRQVDATLEKGGLFETHGTDVCAPGQPIVPMTPWHIPHKTHRDGRGLDILTGWWSQSYGNAKYYWWRSVLRHVGCSYGTWAKERPFHLDVDQSTAS
jgi:hypothetical protein